MSKYIKEVVLSNSYTVVIVKHGEVRLSRRGELLSRDTYVDANYKKYYLNHKLYHFDKLTEEVCAKIFSDAKIKEYMEYTTNQKIDCPYDSFISLMVSQGTDMKNTDDIYVVVPKLDKNMYGTKLSISFNISDEQFNKYIDVELDVYMSMINNKSKKVTFTVEVPDYILDMCSESPDVEEHPETNFIESEALSALHYQLTKYSEIAMSVSNEKKTLNSLKKVIMVVFSGTNTPKRDDYNFAFVGEQIGISFRYCVLEKKTNRGFGDGYIYLTKKRVGAKDNTSVPTNIPGVYDVKNWCYLTGVRNAIELPWTQEREDYLAALQRNFVDITNKLNEFLSDMTEDKIDALISQKSMLMLK